jgi:hypothetical protein
LNRDPPDLCLLSSWDYRREPLVLALSLISLREPETVLGTDGETRSASMPLLDYESPHIIGILVVSVPCLPCTLQVVGSLWIVLGTHPSAHEWVAEGSSLMALKCQGTEFRVLGTGLFGRQSHGGAHLYICLQEPLRSLANCLTHPGRGLYQGSQGRVAAQR